MKSYHSWLSLALIFGSVTLSMLFVSIMYLEDICGARPNGKGPKLFAPPHARATDPCKDTGLVQSIKWV